MIEVLQIKAISQLKIFLHVILYTIKRSVDIFVRGLNSFAHELSRGDNPSTIEARKCSSQIYNIILNIHEARLDALCKYM